MTSKVVIVDCPFLESELREVLRNVLNIRCAFPCFSSGSYGSTVRCMLEEGKEIDADTAVIEDVICKVLPTCDVKNLQMSSDEKRSLHDLYFLPHDKPQNVIQHIVSTLFTDVSRHNLVNSGVSCMPLYLQPRAYSTSVHPGIAAICEYIESGNEIIVVQEYSKHSLLSLSRFHAKTSMSSPSLGRGAGHGSKDLRLRFIIYQLLQVAGYVHSQGLCLDPLRPEGIMLDDDMWVTLPAHFSGRMALAAECVSQLETQRAQEEERRVQRDEILDCNDADCLPSVDKKSPQRARKIRLDAIRRRILLGERHVDRPIGHDEPITYKWVTGKISNMEYLLAINQAAGRSMVDPLYHPVLPWVTDFSAKYVDCSGAFSGRDNPNFLHLRDLTKSKFRLSKGDPQLHTTFRHSDPPHHIPETLSELTYYIYMARCTPLQVLQRIVRNDFVAEHYPHSMGRMYDWTPDECIPEFFTDVSVFESIHKDKALADLETPPFTETAAEFISYHRSVLESDEVSRDLHHWIDLTFGHLLIGDKAIANLNVPLRHTLSAQEKIGDSPNLDKHPGFVILFDRPHPKKQISPKSRGSGTGKFSAYDSSLQAMLDLDHFESGSVIVTAAPDCDSGPMSASGHTVTEERKYLSRGQDDETLTLLNYAKGFRMPQTHSEWDSVEAMKFSARYGSFLEPVYSLPPRHSLGEHNGNFTGCDSGAWDPDFCAQLENVFACGDARDNRFNRLYAADENDECDIEDCVRLLQSQDMFSIGCVIAEVLTGSPIFSQVQAENVSQSDLHGILRSCMADNSPVPLSLLRVIYLLLSPCPSHRPTAAELLGTCCASDYDQPAHMHAQDMDDQYGSDWSGMRKDGVLLFKPSNDRFFDTSYSRQRKELLEDFCFHVFPSYFESVYNFIGRLKVAPDSLSRLKEVTDNIYDISVMPLEGLSLALPHILAVFVDPFPFREDGDAKCGSNGEHQSNESPLVLEYATLVDVLGERLGVDGTEKIIVPRVVKFLNKLRSAVLLRTLLLSTLWRVIIFRAGPRCFLRQFLPLLTTYLVSGTLQSVSRSSAPFVSTAAGDVAPLWAHGGCHNDVRTDWLHMSPMPDLLLVQQASVIAILNLASPDAIGPGLSVRYILPALLCLVGVPRLAVVGFGVGTDGEEAEERLSQVEDALVHGVMDEGISSHGKKKASLLCSRKVDNLSEYSEQHMYVVRSIVGISLQAGDVATSVVVLPKIFSEILPNLLSLLVPESTDLTTVKTRRAAIEESKSNTVPSSAPALAALLEIISLLAGILPILSPETIRRYFFHHFRYTSPGGDNKSVPLSRTGDDVSILMLLLQLPFPRLSEVISCGDSDDSVTMSSEADSPECLQSYVEFRQRHHVHIQLCRLIAAATTYAGPITTNDFVLPAVDKFFGTFVKTYDSLDVESDEMTLAFEIGVELFVPLAQLVGPEAFHTAVPNLNPRLEMWLVSSASGEVGRSPPLPANILPAEESAEKLEEVVVPVKDRGFFNWLTSKASASGVDSTHHKSQQEVDSSFFSSTPVKLIGGGIDSIAKTASGLFGDNTDEDNNNKKDWNRRDRENDTYRTQSHASEVPFSEEEWEMNEIRTHARSRSGRNRKYSGINAENHDKGKDRIPVRRPSGGGLKIRPDSSRQSETYFNNLSLSNAKSTFQATKRNLKKTSVGHLFLGTTRGDRLEDTGDLDSEEEDSYAMEQMHSDSAWLLGGHGRWNSLKDARSLSDPESPSRSVSVGASMGAVTPERGYHQDSNANYNSGGKLKSLRGAASIKATGHGGLKSAQKRTTPAAQISMTAPKIAVDTASEAASLFALKMCNKSSWMFDEKPPVQSNVPAPSVNVLIANPTESFLLGGSKEGTIKLWSLNSHPVRLLSTYTEHKSAVLGAHFMRSGSQVASCDGAVYVWDIETNRTLASLQHSFTDMQRFSHISLVSPRHGVSPDMGAHGDNQLVTCSGAVLAHYDFRVRPIPQLKPVSEWRMRISVSMASAMSSSAAEGAVNLTCSASQEDYVCAGSSAGSVWVLDRRTGRPVHMWQAHDTAVIKIFFVGKNHIISMTDRTAFMWDIQYAELRKVYQLKGLPDCSTPITPNSILLNVFDQPGNSSGLYQDGISSKCTHVMYCMAGHKISAGHIPVSGNQQDRINLATASKEGGDADVVRLTRSYFNDRNNNKLTKNKLHIVSATLLPLRRIMLLGTADGVIRVVV